MQALQFLYPYCRRQRKSYIAGLSLVPLSIGASLGIPYLTGECVAILESVGKANRAFAYLSAGILLCVIVRAVTLFAVRYLVIGASRRLEFELRNDLFSHLQALDQLYFISARTGDLMARMTSDVDRARVIGGPVIMYSANTLMMLAIGVPLMMAVSWQLTLLVMVPLSLLTMAVRKIGPRVHHWMLRAQDSLSTLSSQAQEDFSGVRTVKSFVQEDAEVERFHETAVRYQNEHLGAARVASWMQPIIGGVTDLALLSLLLVGGLLILTTDLTLSGIIKFTGYQMQLLWPMISIGWVVNQYQRGAAGVGRIQEVLETSPAIKSPAEPVNPPAGQIRGNVSIRNLSFSYGDARVLHDVSIEVPCGNTVAIIGRTGSGKSTLVSLLPRIYPVPAGTVFIDGIDVNRISLGTLRRAIGFVPQESFLFSRTIRENIALGVDSVPDDAIYDVASVTRFEKDLDQFPKRYEEIVGERGVTLSGGQRQRAAISRALLIEPRILILDDTLSAVDTQTEDEILANLRRVTRDLTTIIVAHRISSIRHADWIYVLDEGRVVEEGTHEDLISRGRTYAEMHRLQLILDELESM